MKQLYEFIELLRKMHAQDLTLIGTEFCANKLESLAKNLTDNNTAINKELQ